MLKDFKPVLGILLRFIIIYLVLLFAYQFYLNSFKDSGLDPYSRMIADHVRIVQEALGFKTSFYDDIPKQQIWFYIRTTAVSRMVEGCNAISILILFLAFIFAFYKGTKTFVFAGISLLLLYVMNVLRIVGLNVINSDYSSYGKMAHDYFFPAVIYGSVVILWLVWIKFYALKNENS